jgi:hypothetical protein
MQSRPKYDALACDHEHATPACHCDLKSCRVRDVEVAEKIAEGVYNDPNRSRKHSVEVHTAVSFETREDFDNDLNRIVDGQCEEGHDHKGCVVSKCGIGAHAITTVARRLESAHGSREFSEKMVAPEKLGDRTYKERAAITATDRPLLYLIHAVFVNQSQQRDPHEPIVNQD